MNKLTSETASIGFADLESFVRERAQALIQNILEEEVEELLGRCKGERRNGETPVGYRNGHGKERRLATSIGTVKVRRPRVRGTDEAFVSRILPYFHRQTAQVSQTLPELYLHGLSAGDFELAMRGLLGDGAPLSASSIFRLKAVWQAEYETWKQRSLADLNVVYLWVDGIYVKAGLEKDKAALLVVIAALADGTKQVLAVESGHRESELSWSGVLRDLRDRGMNCPRLVVGDGHLGIWSALARVFPHAEGQRCWNHRMRNIIDCVGKKSQPEAKELLRNVMYAESLEKACAARTTFQNWAEQHQFTKAAEKIGSDWERLTAYYSLPKEHWTHLRTSNIIESPFASVRLRTDASKRYKKIEGATAMIWKLLLVAQRNFRKIKAPELMPKVAQGTQYKDGIEVPEETRAAVQRNAA